jgi:multidrug efflux pump
MRHAMGVAVFAGMIGVTAFGIFFTPMFYVLLRALSGNRPLTQHGEATVDETAPLAPHETEERAPAPSHS